ncbi:alpha/beta fold hydrolase [Candidatus Woesearchaeota archaeon]|nr:alpha/beta fold hydrolase [Candidatus Woesearchaeota archaeon]
MSDKVYFDTKSGHRLVGILDVPQKHTGKAVILCHGFSSSKEGEKYQVLASRFVKQGIAALRFDFFGHGESDGHFSRVTLTQAVDDVLSAVDFLEKLGFVDIGAVGVSFGGKAIFVAAGKSRRIKVLTLVAPAIDGKTLQKLKYGEKGIRKWKEEGKIKYDGKCGKQDLYYTFYEDLKHFNYVGIARHVKIPTLIIHGDEDTIVPVSHSQKLFKELDGFKQLEVIIGCNHFFERGSDREQLYDLTVNWIKKRL